MKDDLGDRMKRDYESRTRFLLPRRTYTLLRIDGKAFHTYTHGCARPYDLELMADMDAATAALCKEATEAWFDGNLQKLASISASSRGGELLYLAATGRDKKCNPYDSAGTLLARLAPADWFQARTGD